MKKVLKFVFMMMIVLNCFAIPVYAASCSDCNFTGSKSMTVPESRSVGWTAKHGCAKSIYIKCAVSKGTMYTSQGHSDSSDFARTYGNTTVVAGHMTGRTGGSSYNVKENKCNPCAKCSGTCSD